MLIASYSPSPSRPPSSPPALPPSSPPLPPSISPHLPPSLPSSVQQQPKAQGRGGHLPALAVAAQHESEWAPNTGWVRAETDRPNRAQPSRLTVESVLPIIVHWVSRRGCSVSQQAGAARGHARLTCHACSAHCVARASGAVEEIRTLHGIPCMAFVMPWFVACAV